MRSRFLVSGVLSLAACATASAQCGYTTSLLDAWDGSGPPGLGALQDPTSAWTYGRSDTGALMVGALISSTFPYTSWGSPDLSFAVPLVGPRYSPTPARNQASPAQHRTPGFEGLLVHPNTGADARVIFTAPHALTLTSAVIQAEHLGFLSLNAVVRLELVKPGGTTTLIAPTSVIRQDPHVTLSPSPGSLPVSLASGDRVIATVSDGGSPSEDWFNMNLALGLTGKPVINMQPADVQSCQGAIVVVASGASGATAYQWRRAGTPMPGETGPSLTFPSASVLDADVYDCIVTNSCGSVTTQQFSLSVCIADYNCDTGLDILDFLDFFDDFAACEQSPAPCGTFGNPDVNGDTTIDILDFLDFLDAFGTGC